MTSELRSETSGSTVSLKNLTVAQLINKFSTYFKFQRELTILCDYFHVCYLKTPLGVRVIKIWGPMNGYGALVGQQ